LIICLGFILSSITHAQISDAISAASLSGLTAFNVSIGDASSEARQDGLSTEQLLADVEAKLRTAGIRIIQQPTWIDTIGGAQLFVEANALKHSGAQYSYCIQITVIQKASLPTKPAHQTLAATWSTSVMGVVGSSSVAAKIREEVGAETDRFVSSYLTANPTGRKE